MIVRILGEGQFIIDSDYGAGLDELDALLDWDLESDAPGAFAEHLEAMHAFVRGHGVPLPVHELKPSDAILPAAGSSLDEIRLLLRGEELVPG